jgi:hypothetical protein
MAVRFLDTLGTINQIEALMSIAISFNLHFKVIDAKAVINRKLYSAEVRLEGDLLGIDEFIKKLQKPD